MTTPNGIQTESMRTPNASRAGALHSHSHSHLHRQMSGPKAPSIGSVVEGSGRVAWMGGFAAIIGGGAA